MKPIVFLTLLIPIKDTVKNFTRSVSAVLKTKLPTNSVPQKGDYMEIFVWEDPDESSSQRSEIEVEDVHHILINKKWEQYIYLEAVLDGMAEAPKEGSQEKLLQRELEWMKDYIIPSLIKQGFEVVIAPNTDERTGPLGD